MLASAKGRETVVASANRKGKTVLASIISKQGYMNPRYPKIFIRIRTKEYI